MVDLSLQGITKEFSRDGHFVRALQSVSLHVPHGRMVSIVGASGSGKTTLLRIVAGLEKADAGSVSFSRGESHAVVVPRFGYMFQDARLLPWLTVEKNIALALGPENERSAVDAAVTDALGMVGLEDWKQAYPQELSGGMAQRVAFARALCQKPHILLLDEPFGALDAITRSRLRKELSSLWDNLRLTILFVTHDIEEAVALGDYVVVMSDGCVKKQFSVPLSRPREPHSQDFQNVCRSIEAEL